MIVGKGWNWGIMQMSRGGLWAFSSAWRDKVIMRRLCKNASRGGGEVKERACVHCFWLAKGLGPYLLSFCDKVNAIFYFLKPFS